MAAMMIVNNPGDWGNVYWPLLHAEWNGWTPTDTIFPFFLFIVGVSITLSRKSASWTSILRRGALIIGIGLFLAGYPHFDLPHWRIPGVLFRIGVCYIVAAAIYHATTGDRKRRGIILAALAAGLCILYWIFMTQVPNPAGVRGDLTPDGNWGAYIDRGVFGSQHLWAESRTWDPEGLLSTIPAIGTTLLGIVTGLWLGTSTTPQRKAAGLLAAGVAGILIGEIWNTALPINKKLWTSSFVFFMAGAACLVLAACYWIIDVKGWRGWTKPFVVLGTNAITLYVASGLLVDTLSIIRVTDGDGTTSISHYVYLHYFVPLASPKNASLLYAIANLAVVFVLLAWMYRRRIFIRL